MIFCYSCNRSKYDKDMSDVQQGIKWDALLAWIISSLLGLAITEKPIGLGLGVSFGDIIPVPIICIVAAIIIYSVCQKIIKNKRRLLREQ